MQQLSRKEEERMAHSIRVIPDPRIPPVPAIKFQARLVSQGVSFPLDTLSHGKWWHRVGQERFNHSRESLR